jgi:hypothetical protein
MNRNIFSFFFVISVLFLFQSCAPVYIPNMVNAPLLSNKGEVQASVNTGISGFDPQLAFAVTDKIGLMLNASWNKWNNKDPDGHQHGRRFIEGGIGYYHPFEKFGRFEAFTGFGTGEIKGYFENNIFSGYGTSQYRRFFVQPDIGLCSDFIDLSLSTRLSFVNIVLTSDNYKQYSRNTFDPFFEPVITLKIGYKYLKFISQPGFSFPLKIVTYNYHEVYYNYQHFIFSVGVQLNLGKEQKEKC